MSNIKIIPPLTINASITVPADKSISHRAVMTGSIAKGKIVICNFLMADDCLRTINAFKAMGVKIRLIKKDYGSADVTIVGKGLRGLSRPKKALYLGNSGTTMRLISGILAGQNFKCTITGDQSLSNRPMKRITEPLRLMGAIITGTDNANLAPLTITGNPRLGAIDYKSKIASAQVKSCVLFAGLYADGPTSVTEPIKSRDHTELMLRQFKVRFILKGRKTTIYPSKELILNRKIIIPADFSSAAFFIAAACILKKSELTIKNVGINPTRTGFAITLRKMGADIRFKNRRNFGSEPVADIFVRFKKLHGITVPGLIIPSSIDEIPVLMVVATQAHGKTVIKGASELRVKETDRIKSMGEGLSKMGADIKINGDDITITGKSLLKAAVVNSFKDHRTAMSLAIAGLCATGRTLIEDTACIDISFPTFKAILDKICIYK